MKLFIVISILHDDQSITSAIEGVFKTKYEALQHLKKVYNEVCNDFNEAEDYNGFEDGDEVFEVYEGDYPDIYVQGSVKEVIANI